MGAHSSVTNLTLIDRGGLVQHFKILGKLYAWNDKVCNAITLISNLRSEITLLPMDRGISVDVHAHSTCCSAR